MMTERRSPRRARLAGIAIAAVACLVRPDNARASHDCKSWSRPYLTEIELAARGGREGRDDRRSGEELPERFEMSAGESLDVRVRGFDQNDERFPSDRLIIGVSLERGCDAVSIDDRRDDGFRITAGKRRGDCELVVWVPGNLNLSWSYRVEVEGRDGREDDSDRHDRDDRRDNRRARVWSREEADSIAKRLYRAILARDPDPEGLSDTTVRIQQGRIEERVEEMLRSGEFRNRRTSPQGFLEVYYRGLLGRDPDTGGVRVYLDELKAGHHAKVILAIVRSEEFEKQVRKD